jgi:hypothetical protein
MRAPLVMVGEGRGAYCHSPPHKQPQRRTQSHRNSEHSNALDWGCRASPASIQVPCSWMAADWQQHNRQGWKARCFMS